MTTPSPVAIITGGSGALGSVVVAEFLGQDLIVAVPASTDASAGRLRERFGKAGERLMVKQADLTRPDEVGRFVDEVEAWHGRVDVLINAAGGFSGGTHIAQSEPAEMERMFRINVLPSFLMSRAVLPGMLHRRKGRIILISSLSGLDAPPAMGPYAASKMAVASLTQTIAKETKGSGVTANAIAPSIILTEANKTAMPDADTSRWVTPEEITQLILFLISDRAGSITGNIVRMPGGV